MTNNESAKVVFEDRSGVLGVDTDQLRYRSEEESLDPADDEVVNFCKDCQKIVELKRRRRKDHCMVCDGREIFIGTKRGIKHHFRLKKLDCASVE